ncbi:MAG: hypothetical protein ACJAXX_002134 [Roseivirga sp.]|jgi:hypothetical protein
MLSSGLQVFSLQNQSNYLGGWQQPLYQWGAQLREVLIMALFDLGTWLMMLGATF